MIHETPPKELNANRFYRELLLRWTKDDPANQKAVLGRCRDDIAWWVDSFGWQYNPDNRGSEVDPFILYPFQEEALQRTMKRLLIYRRRVVWEKSRKLGASWLMLFMEAHQCLFFDRQKFLNLSHSQNAVTRTNDPDSLFWKIGFINDHLPGWMTRGVVQREHGFWYPRTKSATTGSATTNRSGVGGRGTVIADEFAKHPNGFEILGQTADTGPCLFCSSHYDMASAYYDLTQRPDTFKIVMHWSDHPDRRKGLYRSSPALAQGYEIIDTNFEYPAQCSRCSGLTTVQVGELTPCCEAPARHYLFITDGKPTGGPHPGIRSPYYDAECVERGNERDVALHLDINPTGAQSQFFDAIMLRSRIEEWACEPNWRGFLKIDQHSGRPLELIRDGSGPIKMWLNPKGDCLVPTGCYGGGADISTGIGATPSVLTIGDAKRGVKVLEYAESGKPPDAFAAVVAALGWLFVDENKEPALLCWEENGGPGQLFGKTILGFGYRNVYCRITEHTFTQTRRSKVPGWWNSPKAMRLLFDSYKAALVNRRFVNRSRKALEECAYYRFSSTGTVEHPKASKGDKPEEARMNHGDHAMADALCWAALEELGAGVSEEKKQQDAPPPWNSFAGRREASRTAERECSWLHG